MHHFARQLGSPFPLLAAVGARTKKIEIGTAVIGMRYERPDVHGRRCGCRGHNRWRASATGYQPRLTGTVGASLPISGLTAWQGLFEHGRLQAGQSVLVHGGAGAVGSMVTQLAREAGAYVIGTGRAADRQTVLDFGAQEFVDLEEACDRERVFIGEIKAGREPGRPRSVPRQSDATLKDVASFLDAYVERHVKPAALKSVSSTCSRIDVLKNHLGELPLDALEEPDEINRFKSGSAYAKRVELATIHRTPRNAARRDELGNGANTTAVQEVAVPPIRCADEQESGDGARPAPIARGGKESARLGVAEDEHA